MNVSTITMDPNLAAEKLRCLQSQLMKRADQEYEQCVAGYEALAQGTPLVDLGPTIRSGGFDEKMRPRLAVARADRQQVEFRWFRTDRRGRFTTARSGWSNESRHVGWRLTIDVDMGQDSPKDHVIRGYALVPMIPADVRAAVRFRARDCVILWEVEKWSDKRIGMLPDRDPYLLMPVVGDLYAVLAEWDLTALERSVMAAHRTKS